MHDLDRKSCRYIALALLFLALVDKLCLYFVPIPLPNIEIVTQASSALWNVLLVMAGFFYGASAKFKDSNQPEPLGGVLVSASSTTETTRTEEIKPKDEPTV